MRTPPAAQLNVRSRTRRLENASCLLSSLPATLSACLCRPVWWAVEEVVLSCLAIYLLRILALGPVQLPEQLCTRAQLPCLNVQVHGCAQVQTLEPHLCPNSSVPSDMLQIPSMEMPHPGKHLTQDAMPTQGGGEGRVTCPPLPTACICVWYFSETPVAGGSKC